MAQKTFLSSEQWQQAKEVLTPPLMTPDGDVRQAFCFSADSFSNWLGARLEDMFKASPHWEGCHPIILGSWARGELSPKSDIDVLFCGDEDKVKKFVDEIQEKGIKLRYRMPHNPEDWTENVEAFDILALLKARPRTPQAAQKLFEQQKRIWAKKKYYRRVLLNAIRNERKLRAKRYDSITNYLEPNLKFGPGGLRDLEQGMQIYELFAEKFTHPGHALSVLNYYRSYFLTLRQKLHLEGYGDILSSAVQFDLGAWMGFKTHKEFMRNLQRGLSRVHFYSDWIIEVAQAADNDLKRIENLDFKKVEDLTSALHKNSSVLVQKKVRENLDQLLPDKKVKSLAKRRGVALNQILDLNESDEFLVSVFRSRLIDKLLPQIRHLVGYVQHDQYHRFTADSHIMQTCREVKRIYKKPSELGPLKVFHQKLSKEDWHILSWSCLYHDLAKGLELGDHHSDLGAKIVEKDFSGYSLSKVFKEEVKWMVKNHLELSQAAFRKNPKDPKVWQDLEDKGIKGSRLYRLALFTVIDIKATNPEAWNEWKAKLLKDLVLNLESKKARNYIDFQKLRLQKRLNISAAIIEELGAEILDHLPMADLIEDLKKAEQSESPLKPLVCKTRKNEVWIRFHDKKDRKGLLSDYVGQLYSLGLGIRNASIHTIEKVGVYDWFQISTSKNINQLTKILENTAVQSKPIPNVKFDQIQLVSADQKDWIISFKGPDQQGLLASAAKALSDANVSVKSARVHTWGRQVDDIFIVKNNGTPQELISNLRQKYQLSD